MLVSSQRDVRRDHPVAGAQVGIEDAKALERVLKIEFVLERISVPSSDKLADAVLQAADGGKIHHFVIDAPAEALDSEHPLFILYTSGSTGKPKGVTHTHESFGWMIASAIAQNSRPRIQATARPRRSGKPCFASIRFWRNWTRLRKLACAGVHVFLL